MMDLGRIERYIDRIYAYAVKRTFTEEEAAVITTAPTENSAGSLSEQ